MKLTLPHQTTQEQAIKTIDDELNRLLKQDFSGVTIIDPIKEWDDNILRFSFEVQKFLFTLEFSGNVIVTDEEVVGETEIPALVTTFVSEEKIKEIITQNFNKLFNIQ